MKQIININKQLIIIIIIIIIYVFDDRDSGTLSSFRKIIIYSFFINMYVLSNLQKPDFYKHHDDFYDTVVLSKNKLHKVSKKLLDLGFSRLLENDWFKMNKYV